VTEPLLLDEPNTGDVWIGASVVGVVCLVVGVVAVESSSELDDVSEDESDDDEVDDELDVDEFDTELFDDDVFDGVDAALLVPGCAAAAR
jgi:hypothetical protein